MGQVKIGKLGTMKMIFTLIFGLKFFEEMNKLWSCHLYWNYGF